MQGLEAFCIFLYFCARPRTLLDIGDKFGRSESLVSRIVSTAFKFVYFRIKSILFWDQARLTLGKLNEYGDTIARKSGINHGDIKYIGMIDGTFRRCARPTEDQEGNYSGWKHAHGIKFQGVMAPDGIMMHLGGPYQAKMHDARILATSGLQERLDISVGRHRGMRIYGDAAYGSRYRWVVSALRHHQLHTPALRRRNRIMSSARIVVEWGFGLTTKYVYLLSV